MTEGALLGDVEIVARLLEGDPKKRLVIAPLIDPYLQLGPSSIDVHLGTDFRVIESFNTSHLDLGGDPTEQARNAERYAPQHRINVLRAEPFVIHPGEFVLSSTLEYVSLPGDLAGRIEGRSSVGRLGLLVHVTAGFVDPGYCGTLTFELYNAGKLPISLYAGLRIAQLCFFVCDGAIASYTEKPVAKYLSPLYTTPSRLFADPEVNKIFNARKSAGRKE